MNFFKYLLLFLIPASDKDVTWTEATNQSIEKTMGDYLRKFAIPVALFIVFSAITEAIALYGMIEAPYPILRAFLSFIFAIGLELLTGATGWAMWRNLHLSILSKKYTPRLFHLFFALTLGGIAAGGVYLSFTLSSQGAKTVIDLANTPPPLAVADVSVHETTINMAESSYNSAVAALPSLEQAEAQAEASKIKSKRGYTEKEVQIRKWKTVDSNVHGWVVGSIAKVKGQLSKIDAEILKSNLSIKDKYAKQLAELATIKDEKLSKAQGAIVAATTANNATNNATQSAHMKEMKSYKGVGVGVSLFSAILLNLIAFLTEATLLGSGSRPVFNKQKSRTAWDVMRESAADWKEYLMERLAAFLSVSPTLPPTPPQAPVLTNEDDNDDTPPVTLESPVTIDDSDNVEGVQAPSFLNVTTKDDPVTVRPFQFQKEVQTVVHQRINDVTDFETFLTSLSRSKVSDSEFRGIVTDLLKSPVTALSQSKRQWEARSRKAKSRDVTRERNGIKAVIAGYIINQTDITEKAGDIF